MKVNYRALIGLLLVAAGIFLVGVYAGWIPEDIVYAIPFSPVRTIISGVLIGGWMLEYTFHAAPVFPISIISTGVLFFISSIGEHLREKQESLDDGCRCRI